MSEEPQEQEKQPVRTGFFSRIFHARQVEDAEKKADESLGSDQPTNTQETAAPQEQPGVFGRWFQKKNTEAEATLPKAQIPEESAEINWFDRLKSRLKKGSGSFVTALKSAIGLTGRLDEDTIERLEEILVASDVSVPTALKIVENLKFKVRKKGTNDPDEIMLLFRETLEEILQGEATSFSPAATADPYVVLVVGVNGVGKTTTIGKMAKRCRHAGLKTMLVAGDTFRAAAVEQLEVWAKRTDSDFIKGKHGADPSGLVYDALNAAKARKTDIVFVDTAGRLQNKASLMEELGKIHRVCDRIIPATPNETLLVIDGTTGQNAVAQTKAFSSIVNVTGLVMTKLDGTSKGGVLLSIRDQFSIPITLIGVGEGIDDLRDFNPKEFASALFADGGKATQ